MTVVVIGAGIHGLAAATFLAAAGLPVRVFEQDRIGAHASGWNAGGLRTLSRPISMIPHAMAAMRFWRDAEGWLGSAIDFKQTWQMMVTDSQLGLQAFSERQALLRASAYAHEVLLSSPEVRSLIPAISDRVIGGLVSRSDGYARPSLVLAAFAKKARDLGVAIHEGAKVDRIEPISEGVRVVADSEAIEASHVVIATGAWGREFATTAGDDVPLEAVGYLVQTWHHPDQLIDGTLLAHGRLLSLKQWPNGEVWLGGGFRGEIDFAARKTSVIDHEAKLSLSTMAEFVPALSVDRVERRWVAIEGETPDDLPVFGRCSSSPRIIYSFGYSGTGFQLGPVMGQAVCDIVAERETAVPISHLSADRFRADTCQPGSKDQ